MPGVPPTRYAYLGPAGTFTEQALHTVPAARPVNAVPAATVAEVLRAVRDGDADAGLVPMENSVEGAVGPTLDGLATGDPLVIAREVLLPVAFGLYTRPGLALERVRSVASHPHGIAQCRQWLHTHVPAADVRDASSTADAAAGVVRGDWDAAVCAAVAGARYRLTALAEGIADNPGAVTRFVLVSLPGVPPAPTGHDVTSLVAFIAHDRTGALIEVLAQLSVRGINLTRIESRPTREALGRYCFFLDCSGHVADARVGEALMGLRRVCADVRFLGSYPRAGGTEPVPPPPGTTEADFADAAAWLHRLRTGPT